MGGALTDGAWERLVAIDHWYLTGRGVWHLDNLTNIQRYFFL